jgi:hypothetical protein
MKNKFTLLFFILLLNSFSGISQRNVKDSIIATPWISLNYGGNWTHADLSEKYGFLNHVGFLAGYKTKRNWFYGIEGNFIFGSKIKIPNLLSGLEDSYGNITDMNGDIATVVISSRGFNTNLTFGKVFPILSPNANSGIFIHGGVGILAHKIRIETQDQVIPSIELEYKKGYDRLSIGPNLHQYIGYALMANRGLVNFHAGFYAQEGFTKNQRNIFFDQPNIIVSKKTMLDIQIGFKIGWFIPIYKRLPKEFYYN